MKEYKKYIIIAEDKFGELIVHSGICLRSDYVYFVESCRKQSKYLIWCRYNPPTKDKEIFFKDVEMSHDILSKRIKKKTLISKVD